MGDVPCCAEALPPLSAPVAVACGSAVLGDASRVSVIPILDGGGLGSSADWLRPRVVHDVVKPLREQFEALVRDWNMVPRLRAHVASKSSFSLFEADEAEQLRRTLVKFLQDAGFPCSDHVEPFQPFLLDAWASLAQLTGDADACLPAVLAAGVPTGILEPIAASGIWDTCLYGDAVADDTETELVVHKESWGSALIDPSITKLGLLDKDLAAGHLRKIPGGESEARARWAQNVAARKLGVVQVPGKKPRLIGDGTVSGANGRSRIADKVRLPGLESVQRFVSLIPDTEEFMAFSFDIRGAHKLVRVRRALAFSFSKKNGLLSLSLSLLRVQVGGLLVQPCFLLSWLDNYIHRFVYIAHGLFINVGDGLVLLPKSVAPMVVCTCLMFLTALGVPLSWEKLDLSSSLSWIGWNFSWSRMVATLPSAKREKLLAFLEPLLSAGQSVERKAVEQAVGLLIWFCGGAYWLKPWLQALYKLLYKPRCVFRSVPAAHFGLLTEKLSSSLWIESNAGLFDLKTGWKLHSVGNREVSATDSSALQCPKLKHGCVECVFYDYKSSTVKTCASAAWAARLLYNAVLNQAPVSLRVVDVDAGLAAADAFASADHAGLGGWWIEEDCAPTKACVRWFSLQITWADLPPWFRPTKTAELQSCIAALEALAQLLLLLGRTEGRRRPRQAIFRFHQLCDNIGAAAAARKQLSMTEPLCFVLQAAGFWCCERGIALCPHHSPSYCWRKECLGG